ncbi:hypothetical protein PRZ48_002462 [Zasmidium cellare]|uniref:Uncharacterized protein n=1 Tax=Zasmidium cellare TaxID=395010 RepID=A0ABR0F6F0_ZASCE|nr:hypothetical protein PRZ48_002462 [Zasmidium cellare]
MDPAAGLYSLGMGYGYRSRSNSMATERSDDSDNDGGGGGGFQRLKKSVSMSSLRSAFSHDAGEVTDTPSGKTEAPEEIPPVPKIPAQYAASGNVVSVEQFPDFAHNSFETAISSENTAVSATDHDVQDEKTKPWLKFKKSFKSLRSLTTTSRPRGLTIESHDCPKTAPLPPANFTLRGNSFGTDSTYDEEAVDTQHFLDESAELQNLPPWMRKRPSLTSLHIARSRAATPQIPHEPVGKLEPRDDAVFTGIGQQAPPDIRPARRPAVIEDGPGDSLVSRSGGPSMPHSDIAEIDPGYWNAARTFAAKSIIADWNREVRAAALRANSNATEEQLAAAEHAARKRRIRFGSDYIKRSSRLDMGFTVDSVALPDDATSDEIAMVYETMLYWNECDTNEPEPNRYYANFKAAFTGKVTPSPGTPYPDIPKPGSQYRKASIPGQPSPSLLGGFSKPPKAGALGAQQKARATQSTSRLPAPRSASSNTLTKQGKYQPRFGYNTGGSVSTRTLPLQHEASSSTLNSPLPERVDSPRSFTSPQIPQPASTPSRSTPLKHKLSYDTLKSPTLSTIPGSPTTGSSLQRPSAVKVSYDPRSLAKTTSYGTLKSPPLSTITGSPATGNLAQHPSAGSNTPRRPSAVSNIPGTPTLVKRTVHSTLRAPVLSTIAGSPVSIKAERGTSPGTPSDQKTSSNVPRSIPPPRIDSAKVGNPPQRPSASNATSRTPSSSKQTSFFGVPPSYDNPPPKLPLLDFTSSGPSDGDRKVSPKINTPQPQRCVTSPLTGGPAQLPRPGFAAPGSTAATRKVSPSTNTPPSQRSTSLPFSGILPPGSRQAGPSPLSDKVSSKSAYTPQSQRSTVSPLSNIPPPRAVTAGPSPLSDKVSAKPTNTPQTQRIIPRQASGIPSQRSLKRFAPASSPASHRKPSPTTNTPKSNDSQTSSIYSQRSLGAPPIPVKSEKRNTQGNSTEPQQGVGLGLDLGTPKSNPNYVDRGTGSSPPSSPTPTWIGMRSPGLRTASGFSPADDFSPSESFSPSGRAPNHFPPTSSSSRKASPLIQSTIIDDASIPEPLSPANIEWIRTQRKLGLWRDTPTSPGGIPREEEMDATPSKVRVASVRRQEVEKKKEEAGTFKLADSLKARRDRAVPKHPALRHAAGDDSTWF